MDLYCVSFKASVERLGPLGVEETSEETITVSVRAISSDHAAGIVAGAIDYIVDHEQAIRDLVRSSGE